MSNATRKRLTRKESAAATRERLLASAREVFVERGYHAASIYEIAERGGRTIGALYSHFGGKEGVFLALIDEHFAKQLEDYSARLPAGSGVEASAEIGGQFWSEFLERDPELVVLFIEFWSVAMRDEEVRARLASSYRKLRAALAELIEEGARTMNVTLPASANEIAIVLDALIDGFALHQLADREQVPAGLITQALRWLLTGMAAEAAAETQS
jgi:AcrR family transcriptional regulator